MVLCDAWFNRNTAIFGRKNKNRLIAAQHQKYWKKAHKIPSFELQFFGIRKQKRRRCDLHSSFTLWPFKRKLLRDNCITQTHTHTRIECEKKKREKWNAIDWHWRRNWREIMILIPYAQNEHAEMNRIWTESDNL